MNTNKKNINNDNLNDIAPSLSKIDKKNPFIIPDDYFDNLPLLIQEKCLKKKNTSLLIKIYEYFLIPKHSVVIALGVILIVVSSIFLFNNNQTIDNNSFTFIDNIINENYDVENIDESLIVETLLSELDNKDIASLNINADINDIDSNDLINYLSDNIEDIDLIL